MKKNMVLADLLGAIVLFTTAHILHIPIGSSGGYIHLDDTMVYVVSSILPNGMQEIAGAVAFFAFGAAMDRLRVKERLVRLGGE